MRAHNNISLHPLSQRCELIIFSIFFIFILPIFSSSPQSSHSPNAQHNNVPKHLNSTPPRYPIKKLSSSRCNTLFSFDSLVYTDNNKNNTTHKRDKGRKIILSYYCSLKPSMGLLFIDFLIIFVVDLWAQQHKFFLCWLL